MIDLEKFEKLKGREGLRRLAEGKRVFSKSGIEYTTHPYGYLLYWAGGSEEWVSSSLGFNELVESGLYTLKPFDVRKAMRDKPDEWVGVYQENDGSLYKVGFDTNRFLAVETELGSKASVVYDFPNVRGTYPEDLERCIPIEDVSRLDSR